MISMSLSRIDKSACLLRFYRQFVVPKDQRVKEQQSSFAAYGIAVHERVENYLTHGHAINDMPLLLKRLNPIKAAIDSGLYVPRLEFQMGLTRKFQPCSTRVWNNCWFRTIPDITLEEKSSNEIAYWDTKTGKHKYSERQLKYNALGLFIHLPHIQKVKATFLWVKKGVDRVDDHVTYDRSEINDIIFELEGEVKPVEDAERSGNWIPRPNKWNCGFCPCNPKNGGDCEYAIN